MEDLCIQEVGSTEKPAKLRTITRATQEEHPTDGQSRNTSVLEISNEYITHISQETEARF